MIAKDKAKELINTYYSKPFIMDNDEAKECAMVCVDEIINIMDNDVLDSNNTLSYWQDVKSEIEKL